MYINLNFQLFIVIFLFCLSGQVDTYTVTLIFIMVHELAHILAGVLLGFRIKLVKIKLLGFNIWFEKKINSSKKSKYDKLLVTMAGPCTNLLIAILFLFIPIENYARGLIVYSNLFLAIINLIPVYPLDGGRLIKELLSFKFDRLRVINIVEKITYISIVIITVLSSVLILIYKNFTIFVGVIFLWYIAIDEWKKNRYRKIAYKTISHFSK